MLAPDELIAAREWVPGIPGDLAFEHLTRAAGRSQDLLDLEELGES